MNATEDTAKTVAAVVQFVGAAAACLVVGGWAWSLAAGSVLGFILVFLIGMLFVAPLVAWGLPAVALAIGFLAQGMLALIRRRSRA